MDAPPIYNPDAEQNAVAAIIEAGSDGFALTNGADLEPDDFWQKRLGRIYAAIQELHRRGKAIDFITVSDFLREKGQLQGIGGDSYLAELVSRMGGVPYTHVPSWAQIVKRDSLLRKYERGAMELARLTRHDHSGKSLADIAHEFETIQKTYLNGHGPSEAGSQGSRFNLLTLEQLFQQPAKQWLWPSLIGKSDLVMFFGDAGSGKTFAVMELIVTGALGKPFADTFQPSRALNIIYLAGEGVSGLPNRFAAAINKHHAPPAAVNLRICQNVPQLFDDASRDNVYSFLAELSDLSEQLDVVVIDTLHSATLGADENHAKDAGVILQAAKLITRELGATVILVHHANKAGGYRGSSALHGAMDAMIQTRKLGEQYKLECFKQKDAEAFKPLFFRLQAEHTSESAYVDWLEECTVNLSDEKPAVEQAKEQIRRLLQDNGTMYQDKIVELVTIGRNNTLDALGQMVRSGELTNGKEGKKSVYDLNA